MRTTGAVTWATLARPHQVYFFFLRLIWPAPLGTLRWTNYSNKVDKINLNVDGSAQDWDCSPVFEVGDLEQSDQGLFVISDITFGNANNVFGGWVKKYGWKDRQVSVWVVYFNDVTFALEDVVKLYDGTGDRSEVGDVVRCALLPGKALYKMKFPRRRFDAANGFNFLPPPRLQFPWGSATLTAPTAPIPMDSGPGGSAPPWWLPPDLSGNPDRPGPLPTTPPPPTRIVPPR